MLLCLDIGNTHILGGVFDQDNVIARFRYATHLIGTSDQFGIFLIHILQANHIDPKTINAAAVCSVVPGHDFTIKHAVTAYLGHISYFVLHAGVSTKLTIQYKNPNELGADILAGAIGGIHAYPKNNLIIIDMGTATTLCAITKTHSFLGGAILPGMRLSMEALKINTAKLMEVSIEPPSTYIGSITKNCIQSGLYFGQMGALKEIIQGVNQEAFPEEPAVIIGTGGFAQLYKDKGLFDVILPDLVLQGIHQAYQDSL